MYRLSLSLSLCRSARSLGTRTILASLIASFLWGLRYMRRCVCVRRQIERERERMRETEIERGVLTCVCRQREEILFSI